MGCLIIELMLAVIITLVSVIQGCSFEPGSVPYMSLEETMYKAPVVLYANYESEEIFPPDATDGNYEYKNAVLRLHCVYKSGQDIVGSQIKVYKFYPQTSCSRTSMEIGKDYILTLSKNDNGLYDLFEGVINGKAAYEVDDDLLATVSSVCGLDDLKEPSTGCLADAPCCPRVSNSTTPCVTTGNSAEVWRPGYYVLCSLLMVLLVLVI